jgi:tetratricopeptide (TPR) repeat protein
MQKRKMMIAGAVAFGISFATSLLSAPPDRFDHKVRNDFFAGFGGNSEAFARAMKVAEETIAGNPNHAEALVWHGAGLYFDAGRAFQGGDSVKGMDLYRRGMGQMDKAVELAPYSIGVRIPRGAALLAATSMQPMDDRVRSEVKRAIDDYQRAFDLQKGNLEKLGDHPLGQLLLGLGDGYSRLGDNDKAKTYFDMIDQKLPGSPWAKRAEAWKANGKLTVAEQRCIGCHVSKSTN